MRLIANQLFPLLPIHIEGNKYHYIMEQRCYEVSGSADRVGSRDSKSPEGIVLPLPADRKISALAYSPKDNKLFFFIAAVGVLCLEPGGVGYKIILEIKDATRALFALEPEGTIRFEIKCESFMRTSYKCFRYGVGTQIWDITPSLTQLSLNLAAPVALMPLSKQEYLVFHEQQIKIFSGSLPRDILSPHIFQSVYCRPATAGTFLATLWAVTMKNEIIQYQLLPTMQLQVMPWQHTFYFLTNIESGNSIGLQGDLPAVSYQRKEFDHSGEGPRPLDEHQLYCGICPMLFQQNGVIFDGVTLLPLDAAPMFELKIGAQWQCWHAPITLGSYQNVSRYWFSPYGAAALLQTVPGRAPLLKLLFSESESIVNIPSTYTVYDIVFRDEICPACIVIFKSASDSMKLYCYGYYFNSEFDQKGVFLEMVPSNSIACKYIDSHFYYYQDRRSWNEITNTMESAFALCKTEMSFRRGASFHSYTLQGARVKKSVCLIAPLYDGHEDL